jgi:hypothetical protein
MKICSHVIKVDTGLAPNPFHGHCTSGLCTPSHMNARLERGDWLIGNSDRLDGNRLVYAMQIKEILAMDDYFHDARFQAKKPIPNGRPEEQCGDNFYFKEDGRWKRLPSRFHNSCDKFQADLGSRNGTLSGKPVFVAKHFFYFGANRVAIPVLFEQIIKDRQGIKYTRGELAERFVTWLEGHNKPGIRGLPSDMADYSQDASPMIKDWLSDCVTKPGAAAKGCKPRPVVLPTKKGCR